MLEIPVTYFLKKDQSYTDVAEAYLTGAAYADTPQTPAQKAFLKELDSQLHNERFYTITDVLSGEITQCKGVGQWLGYADGDFSQKKFLSIVHPAHAVIQSLYATCFFDFLLNTGFKLQWLTPHFISTIALKISANNYLYCKRECFPSQVTDDNLMLSYVSEFTVIKEFDGENYHCRLSNIDNKQLKLQQVIQTLVKTRFEKAAFFSIQEHRILKKYANTKNITSQAIATAIKVEKISVNTYNKRILKKARELFHYPFTNAMEVGIWLKTMGCL